MWSDNAVSAYIVLALGNWLGGITKGVTGFGSAILNLCCWIAFTITGVNSGSLQQAVVSEALSSTLIAPGLLYITRPHATTDFRTVGAISLFVALSSPIGAAILARLDAKRVELVMAAALLAIIVAEQLSKLLGARRENKTPDSGQTTEHSDASCHEHKEYDDDKAPSVGLYSDVQLLNGTDCCAPQHERTCVATAVGAPTATANPTTNSQSSNISTDSSSSTTSTAAINHCTIHVVSSSCTQAADMIGNNKDIIIFSSSRTAGGMPADQVTLPAAQECSQCDCTAAWKAGHSDVSENLSQPLLRSDDNSDSSDLAQHNAGSDTQSRSNRTMPSSSSWRAWLTVLGIGSVAGTLSGIMEGLTGMNGPPIMFMYRRLDTPKATVRGNNAFLNLLQMRLIPYWYMGLITAPDTQLFCVACAAGVVGVVMGNALSYKLNQQVFQQILGMLMVLCCGLMFASGLGLMA